MPIVCASTEDDQHLALAVERVERLRLVGSAQLTLTPSLVLQVIEQHFALLLSEIVV